VSEYDNPRLTCQPSNALSYHTEECRTIRMADKNRAVSWSLIEWHDLEECEYCAGTYENYKGGQGAKA